MSEDLGREIQSMFKSIYEAVDLKYLRPFKRQMFTCGHDCLDDKNNVQQAERCIDQCGKPMHQAMTLVQDEVNTFQGRIDRCLMDCQDDARKEKDEQRARDRFDSCATTCVKKFVPAVPEVVKTISDGLEKLKKQHLK